VEEKFNTYRFANHKEPVIALLARVCTVRRLRSSCPRQQQQPSLAKGFVLRMHDIGVGVLPGMDSTDPYGTGTAR
jgi:hypothetical protein